MENNNAVAATLTDAIQSTASAHHAREQGPSWEQVARSHEEEAARTLVVVATLLMTRGV